MFAVLHLNQETPSSVSQSALKWQRGHCHIYFTASFGSHESFFIVTLCLNDFSLVFKLHCNFIIIGEVEGQEERGTHFGEINEMGKLEEKVNKILNLLYKVKKGEEEE